MPKTMVSPQLVAIWNQLRDIELSDVCSDERVVASAILAALIFKAEFLRDCIQERVSEGLKADHERTAQ